MIGFYDYTTILTYISLLSAISGIGFCISGHLYSAIMCLLFCGLCDMFDGRIARTKKNRTEAEKSFGIQIDSLCDIVAFGVLPAVFVIRICQGKWYACVVAAFYTLAGLIRLAYFNVTEEQWQQETDEVRHSYSGLPITCAALIFPIFACFIGLINDFWSLRLAFCGVMILTGVCFILPFKIRKPRQKEYWLILALGVLVAVVLTLVWMHHLRALGVNR